MALRELKWKSKQNYSVFNQSFFSRTNEHEGILIKGWQNCESWFKMLGPSLFIWVRDTCYQSNSQNEFWQTRILPFSFPSMDAIICLRALRFWTRGYKLKDYNIHSHLTLLHRAFRCKVSINEPINKILTVISRKNRRDVRWITEYQKCLC